MKAIVATAYGAPEVYTIEDREKPTPKPDEVLIKVHAASITPSDAAFRKGDPFIVKLIYGLNKPRHEIPGVEFAGIIEAVGDEVSNFKVGDEIFGMSPNTFGAHAEYVALPAKVPMANKPKSIKFEEIVGILDGAATAMTFLRDVAKLQTGQTILINGASGAVGSYAVQLAKHFGAHVTGVCSGRNIELVQSLGADRVIDYTQQDFTKMGDTYDVIFDAVGKSSYDKCEPALAQNGIYMTTVPTLGIVWALIKTSLFGSKSAKFTTAGLKQNADSLTTLAELAKDGVLKAVIDRCYPMEDIVEAHHYIDTERKRGNVVLKIV